MSNQARQKNCIKKYEDMCDIIEEENIWENISQFVCVVEIID